MAELIGYLGPKGTFTEFAVRSLLPEYERKSFDTIPACIDAVAAGEVAFGVVPIENAIEGSVNLTIDYLVHEQPLAIVAEIIIPIRQHLMVHKQRATKRWEEIEKVYSHPHAIAQCHHFFHKKLSSAMLEYTTSTGAAAEYIKQHPEENCAAVANELAATEYDLEIVERNIHDYENNRTKFIVLSRVHEPLNILRGNHLGYKTTMMITLSSDYAGALHQVLSAFTWRKLNLSKIESRPMKTGLGHYFFVIDVEKKADAVLIPGVKAELEALGCSVTIFGSYPSYSFD